MSELAKELDWPSLKLECVKMLAQHITHHNAAENLETALMPW